MLSWIYLLLAGCMEIIGVFVMKQFVLTKRKIFLLAIMFVFMLSFGFLSLAMREIPMGTTYAIWTGIGACGGVLIGILFFKESKSFLKLFFIFLIITSSIGLKLLS
ncbi:MULTISPECIES: DMT family transporter [Helicobacter]|uniref:Guanidinium exporter n=1 Tax=Helicobacter ibis TaxID=2962633 RepID=A0ABT4VDC0_9HELI|nr:MULTISPECIES: multidrug efflux SMR transporter [Helicobacter]MDA3967226.1 multidrug efflux SMR transporter [Helicobacter sp. WB40]MDA3968707.1 multidrug efflux SMR transporter [Helicobacter ibis]